MISHQEYMHLALAQARLAWGIAKPNPAVGCVLVREGQIVGQGHTQEIGGPHAEVMAIRAAGVHAQGAAAYVTLEPCSHIGRTPPCSQGLIDAGITQVVYGCQDPNPQVAGQGIQQLLAAGVEVVGPVLQEQCQAVNAGFMHYMSTNRPYVFSKLACSLDGRTAMASGQSQWITGPEARARVHLMRAQSCALVTGIGSILADDPSMTCRAPELVTSGVPEALIGRVKQPLRVVIDSRLNSPQNAKIFQQDGPVLLLTCVQDKQLHAPFVALGAEVIVVPDQQGKADLAAVIDCLAQRGCQQIMLEAGAGLNASFLQAGLLQRLEVFMAPKILGASGRPLLQHNIERLEDAWQLAFSQVESIGDDLLLSLRLS